MNTTKTNYLVNQNFPKRSMESWILYLISRNRVNHPRRSEQRFVRDIISIWGVSEPTTTNILNHIKQEKKK